MFNPVFADTRFISSQVSQSDIVDLLDSVLNSPYTTPLSSQFVLTALIKLSARFAETSPSSDQIERIARLLASYSHTQDLEIQQRSVEYGALFNQTEIKAGVLERMPPPEIKATIMGGTASEKRSVGSTVQAKDTSQLLDLMGDEMPASPSTSSQPAGAASALSNHDLLADIFGTGSAMPSSSSSAAPSQAPRSAVDDIMGLFGSTDSAAASAPPSNPNSTAADLFSSHLSTPAPAPASAPAPAAPASTGPQAYSAYDKNGLKITLTPRASPTQPGVIQILARFNATSGTPIEGVNFQAAVPRTQQLQMLAMSNADVGVGATETQQMRVMAPAGVNIYLSFE